MASTPPRTIEVTVEPVITPIDKWNIRNIVERAIWTFTQGAAGSLPVTFTAFNELAAIGNSAVIGGIAALISVAKNLSVEGSVVQAAKRAVASGG